jgi:diaminopimelate decarboxylase
MNHALASSLSHYNRYNGELYLGEMKISAIAEKYGTPVFIYSRDIIRKRHSALRKVLPEEIQILYAIKANPHSEIIALMGELYDGFDISSCGEMKKAITAGISPAVMSFAGPGKGINELEYAIKSNIGNISAESEQEIDHIRSICKANNTTANVMIRVNPDFELTQSGMGMGGPRQFGIDSELLPGIIARIRGDKRIAFHGIHIFSGSQNLNAQSLIEHYDRIIRYALDLISSMGLPMSVINIGGGLGIPYFSHDRDLDLGVVGKGLKDIIRDQGKLLKGIQVRIELGRYLVGECGIYLCRVLYRKKSHDRTFLILDGGMHHHLAASGNLGQSLARRPMPLVTANGLDRAYEKVTVAGPLCTPLDSFGSVEIPHADVGDLIAIMNSGAYGYSASPLFFLSHEPPNEVII